MRHLFVGVLVAIQAADNLVGVDLLTRGWVIEILHADLGNLLKLVEVASGHVVEPLNECCLWEISRVLSDGRHRNADLGYLVTVGQIAINHPVVTHHEQ